MYKSFADAQDDAGDCDGVSTSGVDADVDGNGDGGGINIGN